MKTLIICICTYNRKESLSKCLKSLEKLNNSPILKIIILIVDNTPSNQSFELIKKIKKNSNIKLF